MKTINIFKQTKDESGKEYSSHFVADGQVFKVITGGNGTEAQSKQEIEKLGYSYFDIKSISPEVKAHKKYFSK